MRAINFALLRLPDWDEGSTLLVQPSSHSMDLQANDSHTGPLLLNRVLIPEQQDEVLLRKTPILLRRW